MAALGKTMRGAWALWRPIGSGDILFISSGALGDSWRYRVKNVAEELTQHGFRCRTALQEQRGLPACAERFSVFILHKTNFTSQVAELVERIKAAGKEIIFETDDLIFDPELVKQQDFFRNSNPAMKQFYEKGLGTELVADEYVKTCTVSTEYLAEKLRERGKQVFVVPNKLSDQDLAIAERVLQEKKRSDGKIRVGYFSGTRSHDKDFATVTSALMKLMEKYAQVELFLAGPLEMGNVLSKFGDRIKQFSFVPREKHFANLASVDINIAPLEIGNLFCEARSELKFFEAAVVSVPTVAAATGTYTRAIEDGADGFVANGEDEWFAKLEKLITDEQLRRTMAQKAREKTLREYTIKNSHNEDYYAYLEERIG